MRSARRLALSLALVVTAAIFMSGDRVCRVARCCHQPGLRRRRQRRRRVPERLHRAVQPGTIDVALDGYCRFSTRAPPVPATCGANVESADGALRHAAGRRLLPPRSAKRRHQRCSVAGRRTASDTTDQHGRGRRQGRARRPDRRPRLQRWLAPCTRGAACAHHRSRRLRHRHERRELLRGLRPGADAQRRRSPRSGRVRAASTLTTTQPTSARRRRRRATARPLRIPAAETPHRR